MLNDQATLIAKNLITKKDNIILSLLSKYLGYELHRFNIMHLKDRLSSNINANGYETFCIDGVRLVCFHPHSTKTVNDGLSYKVEAEIKYESYI